MTILIVMNFYLCFFLLFTTQNELSCGNIFTFSEQSYLMNLSPNLVLLSCTHVKFNVFDDFDSFKVISLFVCLLFTRIVNNHISQTKSVMTTYCISQKEGPSFFYNLQKIASQYHQYNGRRKFSKMFHKKINTCTFYVFPLIAGLRIMFLNFRCR